jgi:DNA-binding XRE family transcriptional regulator
MGRRPRLDSEIAHWRVLNNMTQERLAQKLGISPSTVIAWECGSHKPPPYIWLALEALEHRRLHIRRNRDKIGRHQDNSIPGQG